ncbi:hypothetical protein [Xanthomonas campestris]
MQLTFGDAESLGKRKQTRREIFLRYGESGAMAAVACAVSGISG